MKYENMPKGRNKDICVRCGKRANFADRLKSDVQYDLLCLAETTSSGYKTHGNVKLCGKCMSELLMWLDDDDFCSYGKVSEIPTGSEKPNNSTRSKMEQVDKEYPRCVINGTPFDECGFCEHFNCDTCKCEAQTERSSE